MPRVAIPYDLAAQLDAWAVQRGVPVGDYLYIIGTMYADLTTSPPTKVVGPSGMLHAPGSLWVYVYSITHRRTQQQFIGATYNLNKVQYRYRKLLAMGKCHNSRLQAAFTPYDPLDLRIDRLAGIKEDNVDLIHHTVWEAIEKVPEHLRLNRSVYAKHWKPVHDVSPRIPRKPKTT